MNEISPLWKQGGLLKDLWMFQEAIEWFCKQNDIEWEGDFFYFANANELYNEAVKQENMFLRNGMTEEFYNWGQCNGLHIDLRNYLGKQTIILTDIDNRPDFMVRVLFHELVHYRQTRSGKLVRYRAAGIPIEFWEGQRFDSTGLKEYELPWEQEAYEEEWRWYHQWNTQKKEPLTYRESMSLTRYEPQWTDSQKSSEFLIEV